MKKLILFFALILALMPTYSWGAGSCVESVVRDALGTTLKVKLACTGDIAGGTVGTIPTQTLSADTMDKIIDKTFLYSVTAYPTPTGTAPDAADVTVNMNGQDLLGGKGVNLIHATATYDTFPYSTFMSAYRFPAIVNTITVAVANQVTASANWTIELIFSR